MLRRPTYDSLIDWVRAVNKNEDVPQQRFSLHASDETSTREGNYDAKHAENRGEGPHYYGYPVGRPFRVTPENNEIELDARDDDVNARSKVKRIREGK